MRLHGILQPVNGFQCSVAGSIIADSIFCAGDVVIDGARHAHNRNPLLIGEFQQTAVGTVAADTYDTLQSEELTGVGSFLTSLRRTEFIAAGGVKSKTFEKLPYCDVRKVAAGTLRAAKKGRFIYTNKLFYKFYRFLAKVLPAAWLVPAAKT